MLVWKGLAVFLGLTSYYIFCFRCYKHEFLKDFFLSTGQLQVGYCFLAWHELFFFCLYSLFWCSFVKNVRNIGWILMLSWYGLGVVWVRTWVSDFFIWLPNHWTLGDFCTFSSPFSLQYNLVHVMGKPKNADFRLRHPYKIRKDISEDLTFAKGNTMATYYIEHNGDFESYLSPFS